MCYLCLYGSNFNEFKNHFSFWNGKSYTCIACQNVLVICEGRYTKTFIVLLFILFCFALLFYLCALFCALVCCVFMFHCIMYYLLCNLFVHASYLWTCMCYLWLYVNVLYVFMQYLYMSVQKLIASLYYIVCVLPTLNKTYLIWFDLIWNASTKWSEN